MLVSRISIHTLPDRKYYSDSKYHDEPPTRDITLTLVDRTHAIAGIKKRKRFVFFGKEVERPYYRRHHVYRLDVPAASEDLATVYGRACQVAGKLDLRLREDFVATPVDMRGLTDNWRVRHMRVVGDAMPRTTAVITLIGIIVSAALRDALMRCADEIAEPQETRNGRYETLSLAEPGISYQQKEPRTELIRSWPQFSEDDLLCFRDDIVAAVAGHRRALGSSARLRKAYRGLPSYMKIRGVIPGEKISEELWRAFRAVYLLPI